MPKILSNFKEVVSPIFDKQTVRKDIWHDQIKRKVLVDYDPDFGKTMRSLSIGSKDYLFTF
jgi:hypothetical protein